MLLCPSCSTSKSSRARRRRQSLSNRSGVACCRSWPSRRRPDPGRGHPDDCGYRHRSCGGRGRAWCVVEEARFDSVPRRNRCRPAGVPSIKIKRSKELQRSDRSEQRHCNRVGLLRSANAREEDRAHGSSCSQSSRGCQRHNRSAAPRKFNRRERRGRGGMKESTGTLRSLHTLQLTRST